MSGRILATDADVAAAARGVNGKIFQPERCGGDGEGYGERGVYPPNILKQVPLPLPFPPPLPLPFPLPSLPPPLPSPALLSPPLRSRPPLLRLGGLGERFSSPSGSGRSPAAKRYLLNFRLKISPLVATIFRSFSGNETLNYESVFCIIIIIMKCVSIKDF